MKAEVFDPSHEELAALIGAVIMCVIFFAFLVGRRFLLAVRLIEIQNNKRKEEETT